MLVSWRPQKLALGFSPILPIQTCATNNCRVLTLVFAHNHKHATDDRCLIVFFFCILGLPWPFSQSWIGNMIDSKKYVMLQHYFLIFISHDYCKSLKNSSLTSLLQLVELRSCAIEFKVLPAFIVHVLPLTGSRSSVADFQYSFMAGISP